MSEKEQLAYKALRPRCYRNQSEILDEEKIDYNHIGDVIELFKCNSLILSSKSGCNF